MDRIYFVLIIANNVHTVHYNYTIQIIFSEKLSSIYCKSIFTHKEVLKPYTARQNVLILYNIISVQSVWRE